VFILLKLLLFVHVVGLNPLVLKINQEYSNQE